MKEPKCGVCKFTSFIMLVSQTISLSTFHKSSILYMFTHQNPVHFTPLARIHHLADCWVVSTMSQAGVLVSEHCLLHRWHPPNSHYTETATNTHAHTHTHIHTHTHTHTCTCYFYNNNNKFIVIIKSVAAFF